MTVCLYVNLVIDLDRGGKRGGVGNGGGGRDRETDQWYQAPLAFEESDRL